MKPLKNSERILWLALALGWLFDLLFYGKQIGLSLPLFVLALVGGLWWIGRTAGVAAVRRNLWLLLPLFLFAYMGMVRANGFLTFLNLVAVVTLLSYLAFFYAAGWVSGLEMAGALLLPLRVAGRSAVLAGPVIQASVDTERLRARGRRGFFPILRGGLLALPVLFVFTLLLASADLVFADYVDTVLGLDFLPDLFRWLWRGMLVVGVAWLAAGGLALAVSRGADGEGADDQGMVEKALAGIPRTLRLGFVETAVILSAVNLLFLAFTAVQFTYLFGGAAQIGREGYTYAEYARRGFFELVAVAVLSLGLSLTLNWLTRRETKRQLRLFNTLASALVGLVGVMLISAFMRMRLYEAAFGYTLLRLTVYVIIFWLAVLLAWFLWTLWRAPHRFALGLVLTAIGCLATLNLLNPDAFVTRQNLARYQASGDLDVAYLTTLSDDAVPQLVAALDLVQGDDQLVPTPACAAYWRSYEFVSNGEDCQATAAEILTAELNGRYQSMSDDTGWRRWQSFHLARWQAFQRLTANSQRLTFNSQRLTADS